MRSWFAFFMANSSVCWVEVTDLWVTNMEVTDLQGQSWSAAWKRAGFGVGFGRRFACFGLIRFACFGCASGAGVFGWVCTSAGNVRSCKADALAHLSECPLIAISGHLNDWRTATVEPNLPFAHSPYSASGRHPVANASDAEYAADENAGNPSHLFRCASS